MARHLRIWKRAERPLAAKVDVAGAVVTIGAAGGVHGGAAQVPQKACMKQRQLSASQQALGARCCLRSHLLTVAHAEHFQALQPDAHFLLPCCHDLAGAGAKRPRYLPGAFVAPPPSVGHPLHLHRALGLSLAAVMPSGAARTFT